MGIRKKLWVEVRTMTVEIHQEDGEIIVAFRPDDSEEAKGEGFLSIALMDGDKPNAPPCLCCILSVSDGEHESFLVATPTEVTIYTKNGDDITVKTNLNGGCK
jgi:hypothetical protein